MLAGLSRLAKAQNSTTTSIASAASFRLTIPRLRASSQSALSLIVAAAVAYLIIRVGTLDVASNLDRSVHGFLSELRNAPAIR